MIKGGPEQPVEDGTAHWAAHWAARIDAEPDSAHDPDLAAWLDADPRHAGALLRARAVLAMFAPDVQAAPAEPVPLESLPPPRRHPRIAMLAGLGAVAAALALALLPRGGMAVATGTGEVRRLGLADGSSLAIDARSRLTVDVVRGGRRQVAMAGGRALFRVTHDAAHPFQVVAGGVTITDVGTVFEVTQDEDAGTVDVIVSEGAVRVATPLGTRLLVAGQRGRFAANAPPPPARAVDATTLARTAGWTEGRLDLNGEALREAVAEMNRHNQLQIALGTPALGAEPLYGAFRLNDPVAFAQAVAASVGGRARLTTDGLVIER
ncbi:MULTISPECIES: FecR domain-containing protein [unclassified Sphingomonas]|uniref:FecR family protein n=1 Tax=Novosphingobium rhizosphaerae TaxID=1551649 RepID=UPI0015C9E3D9